MEVHTHSDKNDLTNQITDYITTNNLCGGGGVEGTQGEAFLKRT